MSNKPTLGISNFMLDGFMNNGQPVRMRASGWINPSKDDKFDQAKLAIVEQIKKMIIDNNLQISVKIDAKHGDEPQNWPKIGTMTLFANVPRGDAQPQYQAPQAQHQAPLHLCTYGPGTYGTCPTAILSASTCPTATRTSTASIRTATCATASVWSTACTTNAER